MKFNNTTFSIICPVFNKERYIKETIESVINQTYKNWELILIDDGSQDNSVSIVQNYVSEKVVFFKRSDFTDLKGGSVSRNIGIKQAKGSHIIFLDADDIMDKRCLEHRSKFILQNPNYNYYVFDIVHFINDVDNIKENKILYNLKKFSYFLSSKDRKYFLKKFLKYDTQWSICNVVWEKSVLHQLNGFSEKFQRLQDPELHTRALLNQDLKIKFLKYKVIPDIYVRSDHDRSSTFSYFNTYQRVAISIKEFILQTYSLIVASNNTNLIKYLNAYILLFEQFYEGYINKIKASELEKYNSIREDFYSSLSFLMNKRNLKLVKIYKYLANNNLSKKMRLPAVFVFLYKISLN